MRLGILFVAAFAKEQALRVAQCDQTLGFWRQAERRDHSVRCPRLGTARANSSPRRTIWLCETSTAARQCACRGARGERAHELMCVRTRTSLALVPGAAIHHVPQKTANCGNKDRQNRPHGDDFLLGRVSSTMPQNRSVVSILLASVARAGLRHTRHSAACSWKQ